MDDDSILMDFDPNDFLIRLSPMLDQNGNWDGDISVGILTTPENTLDEEDFGHLMHLTTMVAASLPLMEDNATFRKKLSQYAESIQEEESLDARPEKPKTMKIADNIIKLMF